MITVTFTCKERAFVFKIYQVDEQISDSDFPSIVIYTDNAFSYLTPYLYRQLRQVENTNQLIRKTDFIFVLQHNFFGNDNLKGSLEEIKNFIMDTPCINITAREEFEFLSVT